MQIERDPSVLGLICTLQTSFHVLPSYEQLAAMIERGLERVPGVERSQLSIEGDRCAIDAPTLTADGSTPYSIELRTVTRSYGRLELALEDPEQFAPYDPFIKNLANSVATEVESRERAVALEQAQAALEDERRRLADELAHKTDFLALLGHELRNPLAAISSAVYLLKSVDTDEPRVVQARDALERQTQNITRLVDDLLDVSRLSRQKLSLQLEPLDLRELVRDVARDQRRRIEEGGLTLKVELADQPLPAHVDRTRMTQILDNLLQNASKFTDAPGTIELRAEPDPAGEWAILSVTDTGEGIEPELLDELFAPFWQGSDNEPGRRRAGLGLGLALVDGLARAQGGHVEAHSEGKGHGITMRVFVPLLS